MGRSADVPFAAAWEHVASGPFGPDRIWVVRPSWVALLEGAFLLKRLFLLLVVALALLVPVVGQAASGPVLNFYAPNTTTPAITSFAYGPVLPGQSVSNTFTLKNTGGSATAALKITLAKTAGATGAFTMTGDTCTLPVPISLGKGKTCQVTIRFAPVAGGESDAADLTVVSKKPDASQTLHLTGSGAAPNVQITPASKDYGSVGASQLFTATNTGTAPGGSYVFSGPGAPFGVGFGNSCTGASLGIGASCSFTVSYRPSSCGGDASYADTVALGSLASASLTATEPKCPHLIVVSPDSWDFGTTSGTHTFTLTNDGDGPGFISWTGFSDPFGVFGSTDSCVITATLQPGESCSRNVSFGLPAGCGASYSGSAFNYAVPPGLWAGVPTTTSATATFTAAQPGCPQDASLAFTQPSNSYSEGQSGDIKLHNGGPFSETVTVKIDTTSHSGFSFLSTIAVSPDCSATRVSGGVDIGWNCIVTVAPGATETLVALNVRDGCFTFPGGFCFGGILVGYASITEATFPDPDTSNNTANWDLEYIAP
jgi:hypothetical protein